MDEWLDSQGLYRKNTALDGTCLFRAVSEQLFSYHAPNGHAVLREQCVRFLRENKHMFEDKVISGPFEEYLNNLSDSKQWAGQLELQAISLIYSVDFLLFKSIDLAPVPATDNDFDRKLMLCFTPDNFYDAVYPKSYIENAGFCQSIVYGLLYGGVFKLDDLDYAVEKMLHDKSARAQREKYLNSQTQFRDDSCFDFYLEDSDSPVNMRELLDMGAILFPYKVAKALDPDIYRNIEFDNWVDTLRVPRKNSFWFGNGGPLRVGVKCLLKLEDEQCYNAHVQEMSPDCGPVLVFVEELGKKMTVPFDNLEPLPRTSLKPEWTFSHKHQIISKLNAKSQGDLKLKVIKPKGRKLARGCLSPVKYERSLSVRSDTMSSASDYCLNEDRRLTSGVTIAEPDSTTSTPGTPQPHPPHFYASGPSPPMMISQGPPCSPCVWPGGPGFKPTPQVVKTVNVMADKSVKMDFSDLPLSDLETTRFFFNLGIDYFRMGYLVYSASGTTTPGSPVAPPPAMSPSHPEDTSGHRSPEGFRTYVRPEEVKTGKCKHPTKPPRFMKLEYIESKAIEKSGWTAPKHGEEYQDEVTSTVAPPPPPVPEPIPVAVPQPVCTYSYPVIPCVPEPRALYRTSYEMRMQEAYPDHVAHYVETPQGLCEPAFTVPYAVYSHPQYYYQN